MKIQLLITPFEELKLNYRNAAGRVRGYLKKLNLGIKSYSRWDSFETKNNNAGREIFNDEEG